MLRIVLQVVEIPSTSVIFARNFDGKLILGVRSLVNEMMSLLDKLEADAMSEHVRRDGLFDYNCKLESLVAIVKMCQNVARVSSSFRKNFKERSEK